MHYQLKVTLRGVRPPVWRRLVVSADWPLSDLHRVLQAAMGWTDTHLHRFVGDGQSWGVPDPEFGTVRHDDRKARLGDVLRQPDDALIYEYDFGDGWEHEVRVEKVLDTGPAGAKCVDGARACPPEDCGGPHGYAELLEAVAAPEHPEHATLREWLGGGFDPERFDRAGVNRRLARMRPRGR